MPTKTRSYFGYALGDSLSHTAATTSLTRFEPREAVAPRQGALFEEVGIQNLTIEAQAVKTGFGMTKIAELHQHGAHLFDDTLTEIVEVKEQSRGREHQAIVEEFTQRQISMFGRQTLGALEVGGTSIAVEIHRGLYVAPMPPKRRGFFGRLFGSE